MRRTLIGLLLLVAAGVGFACWAAAQKVLAAAPAAGSYQAASRCAGELPWLPLGWLLGPFLLFVPQQTFEWFLEPLPGRYRQGQILGRALLVARFAVSVLMMSAFLRALGMLPECGAFYRLILGD